MNKKVIYITFAFLLLIIALIYKPFLRGITLSSRLKQKTFSEDGREVVKCGLCLGSDSCEENLSSIIISRNSIRESHANNLLWHFDNFISSHTLRFLNNESDLIEILASSFRLNGMILREFCVERFKSECSRLERKDLNELSVAMFGPSLVRDSYLWKKRWSLVEMKCSNSEKKMETGLK